MTECGVRGRPLPYQVETGLEGRAGKEIDDLHDAFIGILVCVVSRLSGSRYGRRGLRMGESDGACLCTRGDHK